MWQSRLNFLALQAERIHPIHRIILDVAIQIRIPAGEQDRILGGPAAGVGIIVPRPKAHQSGVAVVQAAGEAERLEARIGVQEHPASDVVVHPLGEGAVGGVDDQARTAEVVLDQAVGLAVPDQVIGGVAAGGVGEAPQNRRITLR